MMFVLERRKRRNKKRRPAFDVDKYDMCGIIGGVYREVDSIPSHPVRVLLS